MIELRTVSKSYGSVRALDALDLVVPPSRTTVLIGPSGCGKSTVLRAVIGLVRPDSGSVWIDGAELRPENAAAVRRRMGYVIQDGGLFPHLDAGDNIALMARYLKRSRDEIEARLAELAGITRFPAGALGRYPAQLSGGQCQRVSLMRALMLDPDVLLLDEPLGSLDPLVRAELQEDLRDIFRRLGKTVILVTHDLAEAAFIGDEIVLLDEGRIVQRGSLRQLVEEPGDPFVTRFVNAQRSPLESIGGDGA